MDTKGKAKTQMEVGLGEAIMRHNNLFKRISSGIANEDERSEYRLLSDALNEIKLNLGFDCNDDGVPDTIEIFHATASTSCCRFIPSGKEVKTVTKRSTSRSTPAKKRATTRKSTTTKKTATATKTTTKRASAKKTTTKAAAKRKPSTTKK